MKAFPSLSLPRCGPARFLTDLSKALAVLSLWEAYGGCTGFLVSGGEAARAGGQRPAQHLGAATSSLTGPQPRRPQGQAGMAKGALSDHGLEGTDPEGNHST